MDNIPVEIRLFRALVLASLNMELAQGEAEEAAKAFRSGDIAEKLANLFDGLSPRSKFVSATSIKPPKSSAPDKTSYSDEKTVNVLFEDVKRRKVNKSQLFAYMDRVNDPVSSKISEDLSMREALSRFKDAASSDDWSLLVDIINGSGNVDPYLQGMVNRYS
jgi:hypothetical protein